MEILDTCVSNRTALSAVSNRISNPPSSFAQQLTMSSDLGEDTKSAVDTEGSDQQAEKLPWSAFYDQEGNLYYFNSESGESAWEAPERFNPPPAAGEVAAEDCQGSVG